MQFTLKPPGEEFEDEDFEDDVNDAMQRLDDGEEWETVANDILGLGGITT